MDEKSVTTAKVITTTYTCPTCGHSYKDKLDLTTKKESLTQTTKKIMPCSASMTRRALEEHRDAKRRYQGLIQLFKEIDEKKETTTHDVASF